jgi:uncharacterized protein (UPF0335 family)
LVAPQSWIFQGKAAVLPRPLDKLDNPSAPLARHRGLHQAPGEVSVLSGGFDVQSSAKDQLRTIIARIERLEEEKAALSTDLREVYAEAKGNGFDVKALKTVIRIRKQDENKRREEEAVLTTYLHALGMADAPEAEAA